MMRWFNDLRADLASPYAVPLYVVAWRAPWYVLAQMTRLLFVLTIAGGWGLGAATRAWRDTR